MNVEKQIEDLKIEFEKVVEKLEYKIDRLSYRIHILEGGSYDDE